MGTQVGKREQMVALFECTCANPTAECRNESQNWRYKVCNSTKRYLFTRCRYPAFTNNYIRRNVDKPDTSAEDLHAYMENSSELRRNKALIVVCIYLTYCIKNLFVPIETLRMFDYDDFESNIRRIQAGATSSSITAHTGATTSTALESKEIIRLVTCLATNCSHLSPMSNDEIRLETTKSSRLARDISKLPMFKLCHPTVSAWYSPVTALDSLGVLIMLCVSFNAFLLGSWISIQQLIFPAGNEMIMFIVAPAVTARMAWRRTRELLASVSVSYAHFCLNSKLRFFTQTEQEYLSYSARIASHRNSNWSPTRQQREKSSQQSNTKVEQAGESEAGARISPIRSDEELDRMTSECLPIIRTCWWRRALANIILSILGATALEIIILCAIAFKYIQKKLVAKHEQLAAYASEMRRQNCQLWYAGEHVLYSASVDSGQQRQLIDLSLLELKWTIFSRFEGGLFNVMPALGVSMMFAYYWGVISEIEIWLAELRTFLVATLVISRCKLSHAGGCDNGDGDSDLLLAPVSPPGAIQLPMRARTITSATMSSRGGSGASSAGHAAPLSSISQTTRMKAEHFYNITYLRRQFQQETYNVAMAYFTRIKHCHIRPEDGAVVHASELSPHDSNAMLVFKIREIRFMEMIVKQQQQQEECMRSNRQGVCHNPHFVQSTPIKSHRPSPGLGLEWHTVDSADLSCVLSTTELEEDEDDIAHDIYTMEQVYVNLRLFVEHVHGLSPSMGVVLAMTYLLNYGLVCISVMCSRKFADLKTELMFVVVFGWLISNVLIVLAANFHANAKKLQPIMWSIIAELTLSQDNRVKHLRFLWLKQAQILDNQGGLALDAFGLRVTYVNIIQIIIWTVTIIVIALKS